jgi:hypothetical protein
VTIEELRADPFVIGVTAPDLDLRRDADGAPRDYCDASDYNDAMSVTIGFHAVRARIN